MADETESIDISNMPELLRLAQEVQSTNAPRILRNDREDLALLIPLTRARKRRGRRAKAAEDHEAFIAAAGSWSDVDIDAFIADIYESRRISSHPPPDL